MSEASNLPAVISLRIRAAHLRGSMVCKDNVRPRIGMLDRLARPSFDYGRISHPPSTYAQEAQKFERRLPAARRFVVERGLNEVIPGEDKDVGIILQGGLDADGAAGARAARLGRRLWREPRALAGAERDPSARARAAHGVSGRQAARPRARRGHAELHRAGAEGAGLRARLERAHPRQGHGGGPGRVRARGGAGRARALSRRRCRDATGGADRARGAWPRASPRALAEAAAGLLQRLSGAPGVQRAQDRPARAGRDARRGGHRLPRLRHAAAVQHGQYHPRLRDGARLGQRGGADLRQAGDLDPGRRGLLALRPHRRRRQCRLQQAGLGAGHPRELLHLGHRPAVQSLVGEEPTRRRRADVDRRHHQEPRRALDQGGESRTSSGTRSRS